VKRVLVVNPYGIGDVLFATPLLKILKNTNGVERVDVLLGSRTACVLERNPNTNTIYSLDKDALSRMNFLKRNWHLFKFYSSLKKNNYDTFFDLSLTREYAFFAKYFLRIPRRLGFNYKKRGNFLNYKRELPDGFTGEKVPQTYAKLVELIGLTLPGELETEFDVPLEILKRMQNLLRGRGIPKGARIVSVLAGGGASWGRDAHFKQWPPQYFKELLEKIHLSFPLDAVIFIGGEKDKAANEEVARDLSIPAYSLTGKLTLEETAACLSLSRFSLVNEGGIYHLAASLKTPVIALIGPVDEKVYGSINKCPELLITKEGLACRPCYKKFRYKGDCKTLECLLGLKPEEVYRKILESRFLHQLETAKTPEIEE